MSQQRHLSAASRSVSHAVKRGFLCSLFGLLACSAGAPPAPTYTKIVVFGDAFSDTGNVANLTQSNYAIRYPGAAFNYADGRLTSDSSTDPPSHAFTGLWVEQLAAQLPGKPVIVASLDGGTDFAYAGATTADGTTTLGSPGNTVTFTVPNLGQQVTGFLAGTLPPPATTLYVLFGGASDLYSDSSTANATAAAQREAALVQRLIDQGATNFLIPNLPPLGNAPQYLSTPAGAALNAASAQFRTSLATALQGVKSSATSRGITTLMLQPDLYTQLAAIEANPSASGLTNVTTAVQGVTNANADAWLYWDSTNLTTKGHHFIAVAAAIE